MLGVQLQGMSNCSTYKVCPLQESAQIEPIDMQMSFKLALALYWTYWSFPQRSCTCVLQTQCLSCHQLLSRYHVPSCCISIHNYSLSCIGSLLIICSLACVPAAVESARLLHGCKLCCIVANTMSVQVNTFCLSCAAVQAAGAGNMDRAERLCTVFTHFCDFNMGMLGASTHTVPVRLCHLLCLPTTCHCLSCI